MCEVIVRSSPVGFPTRYQDQLKSAPVLSAISVTTTIVITVLRDLCPLPSAVGDLGGLVVVVAVCSYSWLLHEFPRAKGGDHEASMTITTRETRVSDHG